MISFPFQERWRILFHGRVSTYDGDLIRNVFIVGVLLIVSQFYIDIIIVHSNHRIQSIRKRIFVILQAADVSKIGYYSFFSKKIIQNLLVIRLLKKNLVDVDFIQKKIF